jgi:Zn-dependent peptidase ImmA (M78 family)
MNTTAKGNTYEDKVFQLVKRLIADGTIPVGKKYSVLQKKTYSIDFDTDSFIADVSVEIYNPHCNDEISNVIIFECKDLGRKLDKSDYLEWRGRLSNFPYGCKVYFVTPNGYPQPVIDGSKHLGIGLIVWNGKSNEQWIAPRNINEIDQRTYQFSILRGENTNSCFPLVYDNECFYTFGEMLRQHSLPFNVPQLKPPFLKRDKVRDIVNELLTSVDFISIATNKNEDKLIAYLDVKIDFRELPESHNGQYIATDNVIILPNWLISHPHRLRFSIAHELGHAYLHREKLRQYESFFSSDDPLAYNPPESDFHWFDVQANDFASYLLLPDIQFNRAVNNVFSQYGLHRVPFVVDNQKGKFPIYYNIVNALAEQFDVSKEQIKTRLKMDNLVEITSQPNRIGNIIRGF